ncbi:MAG: DUF4340 domain-containing protein [Candidatus Latescibacterota bacterium]
MNRLLVVLLLLAGLLTVVERQLQRHDLAVRQRQGILRPLVALAADRVSQLELAGEGKQGLYVRDQGIWRYPAHLNAVAEAERLEAVVAALGGGCTPVSTEPGDLARYGLDPRQALQVTARDAHGQVLASVRVGRGAPGPRSGETYVQLAGQDTVYQLHANPRLVVVPLSRPLVDPRVLPAPASAAMLTEVSVTGPASYPIARVRRVANPPMALPPGAAMDERPASWQARLPDGEHPCPGGPAWAAFLARLRYEALLPAATFTPDGRSLHLRWADSRADTLETGGLRPDGSTVLRLRSAGQVCALAPTKAALLFPPPYVLLDSLAVPSPFDLAEPAR